MQSMTEDHSNRSDIQTDTIIALASAHGAAGVAVVRVSGPYTLKLIECLTGLTEPTPRLACYVKFQDPKTDQLLDEGILIYFKGPHSFTGEDVAEFHLHGSKAIVDRMIERSILTGFVRMADHGEYSKRAYLNGKIDLTEAEGIADLVAAETEAQADLALNQMQGGLRLLYEGWAERLTRSLAYMEASIDFSDEDDIEESLMEQSKPALETVLQGVRAHLNDNNRGERLRDGIEIAILGPPNAGKSSLINTLARREAAIVSDIAGTTRDLIEVHLNLGGYPVILIDTAGLHEARDKIEQEGIRRALARADEADLKLLLLTSDDLFGGDLVGGDLVADKTLKNLAQSGDTLTVLNKIDLNQSAHLTEIEPDLRMSVETGEGLDHLLQIITEKVKERFETARRQPFITRRRHRETLEQVRLYLKRAAANHVQELKAEDVRLAVRALGRLTGRVDVEDLLDVIFRDFCIGK